MAGSDGSEQLSAHPIFGCAHIEQNPTPDFHSERISFRTITSLPRSSASTQTAQCSLPSPHWSQLGLITQTPNLLRTLSLAEIYAKESIPVLLLGKTGTGKDLMARGIHDLSGRDGHFVPVNCAAAQRDLFAAELFGARKGAYTGATDHRRGLIEEAAGGTLFFDEVADLDPKIQGLLLRFLDSGEIRPLGSAKWLAVDARILAATCRDLRPLVDDGSFRPDLFARLAGVVLRLPQLQARPQDLVPLLEMFWTRLGGSPDERKSLLTPGMMEELRKNPWPGNVRDLRHFVALAIPLLRRQGPTAARMHLLQWLAREWLKDEVRDAGVEGLHSVEDGSATPQPSDLFAQALAAAKGHVPTAARMLGVSRSQAYRIYKDLREGTK